MTFPLTTVNFNHFFIQPAPVRREQLYSSASNPPADVCLGGGFEIVCLGGGFEIVCLGGGFVCFGGGDYEAI